MHRHYINMSRAPQVLNERKRRDPATTTRFLCLSSRTTSGNSVDFHMFRLELRNEMRNELQSIKQLVRDVKLSIDAIEMVLQSKGLVAPVELEEARMQLDLLDRNSRSPLPKCDQCTRPVLAASPACVFCGATRDVAAPTRAP